MSNLVAYFDESGTHEDSDHVAVAGFIGFASAWVDFCARWQLALNDFGLSYFHMTDFANRVKPYDTWLEETRRSRLSRLLNIIDANVIGSVGFSVPKKSFESICSPKAKEICGGAYGLAAIACFLDLGNIFAYMPPSDEVTYVFERGSKGAEQIRKVFQSNRELSEQRKKYRLGSLRFEDKRDYLPLQAADILAYEIYKESQRMPGKKQSRYPLQIMAELPHNGRYGWGRLDDNEIQKFAGILSYRAEQEDKGELPPL